MSWITIAGMAFAADPATLHGKPPAAAKALPAFSAVAQDGTPRGPEALRGHASVLWFFPIVDTPG